MLTNINVYDTLYLEVIIMNIKDLEEIKDDYVNRNVIYNGSYEVGLFMIKTVDMFVSQANEIQELYKQLAKKGDNMDFSQLKHRYQNNAEFHSLVRFFYNLYFDNKLTFSEVKEAMVFAKNKFDMKNNTPL